jgi:hypothetical protein
MLQSKGAMAPGSQPLMGNDIKTVSWFIKNGVKTSLNGRALDRWTDVKSGDYKNFHTGNPKIHVRGSNSQGNLTFLCFLYVLTLNQYLTLHCIATHQVLLFSHDLCGEKGLNSATCSTST